MRIAYIVPGVGLDNEELIRRQEILRSLAFKGTEVDVVSVDEGPYTIESGFEEEYAAVSYLRKLYEVEDYYDAFIIGCFGDPGLRAARELVSKPVVGPGEASYAIASLLSRKFIVLTPLKSTVTITWDQINMYGYTGKVYDVIPIDIKVADIQRDREELLKFIKNSVKDVLSEGKAEAIVLGCMSMGFSMVDLDLSKDLHVPVVNPVKISLKLAEVLAYIHLTHSKLSYPTPPLDKIRHLLHLKPNI
jgi:allantoin racemase